MCTQNRGDNLWIPALQKDFARFLFCFFSFCITRPVTVLFPFLSVLWELENLNLLSMSLRAAFHSTYCLVQLLPCLLCLCCSLVVDFLCSWKGDPMWSWRASSVVALPLCGIPLCISPGWWRLLRGFPFEQCVPVPFSSSCLHFRQIFLTKRLCDEHYPYLQISLLNMFTSMWWKKGRFGTVSNSIIITPE